MSEFSALTLVLLGAASAPEPPLDRAGWLEQGRLGAELADASDPDSASAGSPRLSRRAAPTSSCSWASSAMAPLSDRAGFRSRRGRSAPGTDPDRASA